MQEKWRIAGDKAGSGNTTNIGSISGMLADFQQGNGVFQSESEFLAYWRGIRTYRQRTRPAVSQRRRVSGDVPVLDTRPAVVVVHLTQPGK